MVRLVQLPFCCLSILWRNVLFEKFCLNTQSFVKMKTGTKLMKIPLPHCIICWRRNFLWRILRETLQVIVWCAKHDCSSSRNAAKIEILRVPFAQSKSCWPGMAHFCISWKKPVMTYYIWSNVFSMTLMSRGWKKYGSIFLSSWGFQSSYLVKEKLELLLLVGLHLVVLWVASTIFKNTMLKNHQKMSHKQN